MASQVAIAIQRDKANTEFVAAVEALIERAGIEPVEPEFLSADAEARRTYHLLNVVRAIDSLTTGKKGK